MLREKAATISTRVFWLASVLFFISGGTGLAYQFIWFKRFSHVWGSTSLAFAAVGGSFLFGLGLGAFLLGRLADRSRLPLRYYGLCELLIGLLALVIPYEIAALVDASASIYSYIPDQLFLRFCVQFCITLLVIGPPCVLMGGTLPLLIRQLTPRDGSLDEATGWLYAINTFGAATGCYLTGFHLLPTFGLMWTNNVTAAINLAIGAVSLLAPVSALERDRAPALESQPAAGGGWTWTLAGLTIATVFSGAAALILEMTWSRQLALILGGSTYAYSATLVVVLTGIALGSLIFHVALRRFASSPVTPVVVVTVLIVATLVGKMAIPALSEMMGERANQTRRADQFWNALFCLGVSGVIELVSSIAMGILFPLFVHMTRANAAHVGAAVGNIYAWNTVGSILGASLTSVLLFPWIGTAGALALAVGLYVVAVLVVVPWRGKLNIALVGFTAVAGIAALIVAGQQLDPRNTNMGFYLYGPPGKQLSSITPLYFREGASCNVFVSHGVHNDINLRVNGKVDASIAGDMMTQIGVAYFPRFFKADAKEVMVIGFGSGTTAGRCMAFPKTNVTCCEIEPAVYGAADQFALVNNSPQKRTLASLQALNAASPPAERWSPEKIAEEARFSIVFADGRTAVQASDKKYDLIISEPSNPWLAGVSNLFTKEFFRTAREHLNEDGVLAQWIQTYNFTVSDYAMVVRTLSTEFPYFGMIKTLGGIDTVLLASRKPLIPTTEGIAAIQAMVDKSTVLTNDLRAWYGGTDVRWILLQHYELDRDQLQKMVDSDPSRELNTDLNMHLEFDAPLRLFKTLSTDSATTLTTAATPEWRNRLAEHLGLELRSAQSHLTTATYLFQQFMNPLLRMTLQKSDQLERAGAEYSKAIVLDPNLVMAHRGLAAVRRQQKKLDDVITELEAVLRLTPDDAAVQAELAQDYSTRKQLDKAVALYRKALQLEPVLARNTGNHVWANNLAWILATSPDSKLRDGTEALRWSKAACELTGFQEAAWLDTLAVSYAELGQYKEAIKVTEMIINMSGGNAKQIEESNRRIKLYELSQPFREL